MISVSEFSKQSSVWSQAAPTLEQLVRWVNSNLLSIGSRIDISGPTDRNSLIAETAFQLASYRGQNPLRPAEEAEAEARRLIIQLPRGASAFAQLRPQEWHSATTISQVITNFVSRREAPQYSPRVPGCGVVDASNADVLAGSELIEVKTVNRQFRGSDYRQVLTYAAMLYASGTEVESVTLLNPRQGDAITLTLDHIAAGASGQSRVELMQDLVNFMIALQVSA